MVFHFTVDKLMASIHQEVIFFNSKEEAHGPATTWSSPSRSWSGVTALEEGEASIKRVSSHWKKEEKPWMNGKEKAR
ncbi:hypothetical protein LR48_Vigan11g060600 [Vigna angularis]|uniref:Uncharacterized protein n=1 Tax=Phaseolus angularis TaxID=3914 RepID=A0A0L9VRK1_PHAAN|nr:hypothetical protein LR48_Vigan11g060600 [Vigna angularis]